MKVFEFKHLDTKGADILNTIALASNLNQWMYDTIRPFCKGNILEIGSGIGNISDYFLKDKASIMLSDISDVYCDLLKQKYIGNSSLLGIENMNLVDADFDTKFSKYLNSFETVFALNVVEHIFDDNLAISNCYKLLKPVGNLIILVPAYQWLYNDFDKELQHYRRYTRNKIESLFSSCNLKILNSQYFNAAGITGWFVSGKIQHHKIIPEDQIRFFNKMVVLFRLFDKLIFNSFGLSVITVGKK